MRFTLRALGCELAVYWPQKIACRSMISYSSYSYSMHHVPKIYLEKILIKT